MYKLTTFGVLRLADMASIPDSPLNADWQDYQAWLALDNTPAPADVPTAGQLARQLEIEQSHPIAKTFYASHPAITSFIRDNTPAQREAQIQAMTLAQLRTVVVYLVEAVVADIKQKYMG